MLKERKFDRKTRKKMKDWGSEWKRKTGRKIKINTITKNEKSKRKKKKIVYTFVPNLKQQTNDCATGVPLMHYGKEEEVY